MSDFNNSILQALAELSDGQRAMREEMNFQFDRINGRLRTAEATLVSRADHTDRLSLLEGQGKDIVKQITRVKAILGTLGTGGTALWALVTNWDALKAFLFHRP